MESAPLLSICIPTYNRGGWLRAMLATVVPQAKEMDGVVEVVVSDNASTDDTAEVVRAAQAEFGPITYSRNETNIGGEPNFHKAVNQVANGKFAWLLGDDDFLAPGAVRKVVEVLVRNPELTYIYVAYQTWECESPPAPADALAEIEKRHSRRGDSENRHLDALMEIVGDDPNLFTPISCSIMRREDLAAAVYRDPALVPFATAQSVSPISLYIASNLLQRPAWCFREPLTYLGTASSWDKYHPAFALVVLPELFEHYERNGAPRRKIDAVRSVIFASSAKDFRIMQSDPATPGREYFSYARFLWQNRRIRAAWMLPYHAFFKPRYVAPVSRFFWSFAPSRIVLSRLRNAWHQLRGRPALKDV